MNVLNKFGMLILSASLLAACGDSGNKGSSDKPAEQVAQSESSSANKYEKALSEFPEADPKLAEPIVISDKNLQTVLPNCKNLFTSPPVKKLKTSVRWGKNYNNWPDKVKKPKL